MFGIPRAWNFRVDPAMKFFPDPVAFKVLPFMPGVVATLPYADKDRLKSQAV